MATQDLCSSSDVRTFLQKTTTDTAQDTEIGNMITAASDAIMRWAEREFKTTTSGSTARSFEHKGGAFLDLAPFDLRSVSAVEMDADQSSSTVLTSDQYRLHPVNSPHGVYTGLRLDSSVISTTRFRAAVVEVTSSTWGFASVPSDVKRACVITVATWLRRDVSAYENVLGPEGEEVAPRGLPMPAVDLLKPFKREIYT